MALFDEDNDVGTATIAIAIVLGTLVVGTFVYAYNKVDSVQTAFGLPTIEKTVPSIVPIAPQL